MVGIPDGVNACALGGLGDADRVHLLRRRVMEEHVHVVAVGLTVGVAVKPDFHAAARSFARLLAGRDYAGRAGWLEAPRGPG